MFEELIGLIILPYIYSYASFIVSLIFEMQDLIITFQISSHYRAQDYFLYFVKLICEIPTDFLFLIQVEPFFQSIHSRRGDF